MILHIDKGMAQLSLLNLCDLVVIQRVDDMSI